MKKLELDLKRLLRTEKILVDIVFFGSALKSKEKPDDLDTCIILREKEYKKSEEIIYEIVNLGRRYDIKIHCEPLVVDNLWTEKLFLTLLHEGYSVSLSKNISDSLNYVPNALFTYALEGKTASEKVMFSYALYGRKTGEGLLSELKGSSLGRGAFTIPVGKSEIVREFLNLWKIKFEEKLIINIRG